MVYTAVRNLKSIVAGTIVAAGLISVGVTLVTNWINVRELRKLTATSAGRVRTVAQIVESSGDGSLRTLLNSTAPLAQVVLSASAKIQAVVGALAVEMQDVKTNVAVQS